MDIKRCNQCILSSEFPVGCYRVSTMLYCHCEHFVKLSVNSVMYSLFLSFRVKRGISSLDCFVTEFILSYVEGFLAMTFSCCNDQRDYLFCADTLRLAAGGVIEFGVWSLVLL